MSPDHALAELAARQHGVVSVAQLIRLGLRPSSIKHRVRIGRLHRVYRGVYAVGYKRLTLDGRYMAAVLACGERAVLSHRSAGDLWGLRTGGSRTEVTVPRGRHGPQGIQVHETRRIPPATTRDNIPLTTLGRTLVDLADVVSRPRLERAFDDAERLQILDVNAIHPIPGRMGTKAITALITERRIIPETKSELERRFAEFIREAGLPWPVFNTLVEEIEVDVLWRDQRLVVELDSWEYHRTRKAFEDDRAKEPILRLAEYNIIRVTSRRLTDDRPALLAQIRTFLDRGALIIPPAGG